MSLKKTRIFINGFGRIGRSAARIILEDSSLELVGINDIYSYDQMTYLLKYDSTYGTLHHKMKLEGNTLLIDDRPVRFFCESDPENLSLSDLEVDVVLQCSGIFLTTDSNRPFLTKGVKKVIISAPAADDTPTYILGVNHHEYEGEAIISNSSCSANAIVPIFKIIDQHFGIKGAMMSMYHSYTLYQNLLDAKHYSKDIRRTRSATLNIIPLMSSAAEATGCFFPHLKEKLYAKSIRVPIPSCTLYDLVIELKDNVTKEVVNQQLRTEIASNYQGILETTETPNESDFYIENPHSAVINLPLTTVSGENLLRISAWQDNEYGYAMRLVGMAKAIS